MSRGIRLASSSLVSMRRVFCRDRQSYGLEEILNISPIPPKKSRREIVLAPAFFIFARQSLAIFLLSSARRK